jgi:GTP-binding protein EngB required for normal cell division
MMFTEKPKTAVIFLGNMGAGKSTLLSQLIDDEREFQSGVSFMSGLTKEVSEHVDGRINGEPVILIDTPGLYEPSNRATKANAEKLTEALSKGYNYKIFFVLKATNRGLTSEDLALMSYVNKSVCQDNGAKVEYQVIINQIKDDETFNLYETNVANDCFRRLFESLDPEDYEIDIQIAGVTLLRFDKVAVKDKRFRGVITRQVQTHVPVQVKVKPIVTDNKDLKKFGAVGFGAVSMIGAVTWAAEVVVTGSVVTGPLAAAAGVSAVVGSLAVFFILKK